MFGSATGFELSFDLGTLDDANGFRLVGSEYDYSGVSVAGAGDVNGDGIDDLIIGAARAARSYVVFGSTTGFGASVDLATLDGTNGFRLEGIDSFDDIGHSVAGAGDVNGDGIGDLIVGAPSTDRGDKPDVGVSYVVFGLSAGFAPSLDLAALDGTNGFRIDGANAYDGSGGSVAGAGDVNGDGIDDLIIGAPGAYGSGASYVVFGSSTGFGARIDLATLDGTTGIRLKGVDDDDRSGASVAGAGDVNGDGFDDLIVGSPGAHSGTKSYAGESYVVFGSARLGGSNEAPVAADDTISIGSLDVIDLTNNNGEGIDRDPNLDDLTVTAINGTSVTSGDAVTLASGLQVVFLGDGKIRVEAPGIPLGASVSDSFVYEISDGRGASDTATASVDFVQNAVALAALDGSNGFRLDGIDGGGEVAGAGDVNGDGIDDLIIGAPFADSRGRPYAGESFVVFGSAAGFGASLDLAALDGSTGFRIIGKAGDLSGLSVAGAGDVNGDGIDDLIIGAPGDYYSNFDPERVDQSYVVFGSAAGFAASFDLAALDGSNGFRLDGPTNTSVYAGFSVAGAGDINGDGIDDLVIGTPGADSYAGESFVVFGSVRGFGASLDLAALDGSNGFRLDGIDARDNSGHSVAGAGDINGDGIDDLVIGAPGADSFAGESYVVFGSLSGFGASLDLAALDGTNGFRLDGIDPRDGSGSSVAGAGDINGDGIADLIIGAAGADPGGESYVVFGSAAGFRANIDIASLDGSNGFSIEGIAPGDYSGSSVASAGDFNGDGIDDLIIGARNADPKGQELAGESYVVFGTATGFGARIDLADLDPSDGFVIAGIDARDYSGDSVAGAGDVNGDGFDDLIVGARGESYVVFGFSTAEAGTTMASVAASTDDAEQGVGGRMQLASHDLDIGQRAGKPVGLRFTGLEVPEGATVTGAYIEFEAKRTGGRPSDITIAIEDTTEAASFGCGRNSIGRRDWLDATTDWAPERWVKGESYRTADLAATIAALVGSDGLDADDALVFRFTRLGERTAGSFDGKGVPAKLVIEFEEGPEPAGPHVLDALADQADAQGDAFRFLGGSEEMAHGAFWDSHPFA